MSEVDVIGRGPMSQREAYDVLSGRDFSFDPRVQSMAIQVAFQALEREVMKMEQAEIVDCEYIEV